MNEELQVRLATDVVYVYGTINGVEATFSLVEVGLWTATVLKAVDGKYVVSITTYNSLGDPTLYETTIYKLDSLMQPKLNWTKNDYYNAEDLVRVEANTQYVSDMLHEMGYIVSLDLINTNWNTEDFPFITHVNRIESNIDSLKNCFYAPYGWQDRKIWVNKMKFSYLDAIRFEKNLYLLMQIIDLIKDSTVYSGTFNAGQEVIL